MPEQPQLSIVVLSWNQLDLTRACVASLREHTDVAYELIIVDNGSEPEVAAWVNDHADRAVLLGENRGFASGMNAGLAAATGSYVAFVNNDTAFPAGWAGPLLETAGRRPGITVPAVTAAGGQFAVRSTAGSDVVEVEPFRHLPSGVVYLMKRQTIEALGGWDERYEVASREDLDLLFTFWVNGLSVTLDTRVLVDHVSSATVGTMADRQDIWHRNWGRFIDKWTDLAAPVARLDGVEPREFAARRIEAATVATWMQRWYEAEEARKLAQRSVRDLEAQRRSWERTARSMEAPRLGSFWSKARNWVPSSVRRRAFPHVRGWYYRAFPAGRAADRHDEEST